MPPKKHRFHYRLIFCVQESLDSHSGVLVGVLLGLVVVTVAPVWDRVPTMDEAFTSKSPSFPSFAASWSVLSTSLSLTVELKFRVRSAITLPHLGGHNENVKETFKTKFTFNCKITTSYQSDWTICLPDTLEFRVLITNFTRKDQVNLRNKISKSVYFIQM